MLVPIWISVINLWEIINPHPMGGVSFSGYWIKI